MLDEIKVISRKENAALQPTADAAAEAGDGEALGEVMNIVGPAWADARAIVAERQKVATNGDLSAKGIEAAMAALEAKRVTWGEKYMHALSEARAKKLTAIEQLEDAADRGLEPHGTTGGFVARHHEPRDAVQAVQDSEARGEMRKLQKSAFNEQYRGWVINDDRLAYVADADPMHALVSPELRAWAKSWRVEHSPLLPGIRVRRAQLRTIELSLVWLGMEFGVKPTEAVDAVA